MATAHRGGWWALAALAIVAGCSSDPDGAAPTTGAATTADGSAFTTEVTILTSDDGVVEVEVPAGVPSEIELSVASVDPAEMDGIDGFTAIGRAYRFEPVGLRFPEPLTVTYRVPGEAPDAGEVPLHLFVREVDGVARPMLEQRTEIVEGTLEHRAGFDGFGTVVLLDGGVRFAIDPVQVADLTPGDGFDATLTAIASPDTIDPWPEYGLEMRWLASGNLGGTPTGTETTTGLGAGDHVEWVVVNTFTCDVVGSGVYAVEVAIDVQRALDDAPSRQFVMVGGEATCGDVGR